MRKIKNRVLFEYLFLAVCGLRVTLGQSPSSPCPSVFSYQKDAGRWYGVITGRSSVYGEVIKTVIEMEYDGILRAGEIKNIDRLTSDDELRDVVARGGPIRYRLDINVNPLPRVIEIEFNGRIVCDSPRDESRRRDLTTARREHTLYPNGGSDTTVSIPQPNPGPRPRPNPGPTPRPTPPLRPRPNPQITPGSSVVCGVQELSKFKPTPLIAGAERTEPGDWPWLVALFHAGNSFEFQCGASLLGTRFIITAAHCLYDRIGEQVDTENIIIIAGASDVSLETKSEEFRSLSALHIHEEYDTKATLNDIALLVLQKPVTHSKFIKPICLWEGDDDQNDLADKNGMVVGWGDTGDGPSLKAPLRIAVPFVSLTTCRGENPRVYELTNDKSLCAGKKDRKGPCKGDSGSGLYVEQNGRWRLRGVVSLSLEPICGPESYVVYTDVAKFTDWINYKIFNHFQ